MEELVNYGALGLMLGGFLMGAVVAKPTHDRLIAERDRAEKQRDEVLRDVLTNVAPAIERATAAVQARDAHDSEVYEVLVDVRRYLEAHR